MLSQNSHNVFRKIAKISLLAFLCHAERWNAENEQLKATEERFRSALCTTPQGERLEKEEGMAQYGLGGGAEAAGADPDRFGYFRYTARGRIKYFAFIAEVHPQTRTVLE